MDKEVRAELLRSRFRATGGIPYVSSGKPRRFRYIISGRPIRMSWNEGATRRDDRAPDWIATAESRVQTKTLPEHRHGPHVLTKIAAQLLRKLPTVSLPQ